MTDGKRSYRQQKPLTTLGGVMQRQIFNSNHGRHGNLATRFGALLATAGLLLLSACDGGGAVTENNLVESSAATAYHLC